MTNRRKFLERSALGFGSVLFLPGLLASCTDHLPGPGGTPINPPLLGDTDIDWNDAAKKVVTTGLEAIPEAGEILGPLVDILWPGTSTWDKIKDQVTQLVNQKFDTDTYTKASGKLDDLKQNMQDYLTELKDGTPAEINSKWGTVVELFVNNKSVFTTSGYEVILLPLFAQYSNLYLSLLRDPLIPTKQDPNVLTGKNWGMTDQDISNTKIALQDYITSAVKYAAETYNNIGRVNVAKIQRNDDKVEPFRSVNAYDRQMTMLVLDYMDTWPYYDVTKYPIGAQNPDGTLIPLFTRTIYSDPYGNIISYSSNPIPFGLPSPATQFPTQITVWGGNDLMRFS